MDRKHLAALLLALLVCLCAAGGLAVRRRGLSAIRSN